MTEYPTFAITTPVLNKAAYIRETIESVINQKGDFYIDYFVMDGESTDGTVEILREYEERVRSGEFKPRCRGLKFAWASGKDKNMYDAVNRGFARVRGDYMAYINADDVYMPWAFSVVAEIFGQYEQVEWLTSMYPMSMNEKGQSIFAPRHHGFNERAFLRGCYMPGGAWFATHYIQQDSVFWRTSLWEKSGGELDIELKYGADFELWARFFRHSAPPVVGSQLSAFRFSDDSSVGSGQAVEQYAKESMQALLRHGGKPSGKLYSLFRGKLAWRLFAWPVVSRVFRSLMIRLGVLDPVLVIHQRGNEGRWVMEEKILLDARLTYV